jgi:hypothetical protein
MATKARVPLQGRSLPVRHNIQLEIAANWVSFMYLGAAASVLDALHSLLMTAWPNAAFFDLRNKHLLNPCCIYSFEDGVAEDSITAGDIEASSVSADPLVATI